jgi:O-antigen/teichoic acid export membrane protein
MFSKLLATLQKQSPNFQKIAANVIWLLVDKFLGMVTGLLVGIWLARYLGPVQFGVYSYALSFVALFNPIMSMGLRDIVVRDLARDRENQREILGSAGLIYIGGGIAACILSTVLILLLAPSDRSVQQLVLIMAIAMPLQSFDIIDIWFQSQVQSKYTVVAKRSANLIAASTRIFLILTHASLTTFAWVFVLEALLTGIGLWIIYQHQGHSIGQWRYPLARMHSLMQESVPLLFAGIAVYVYSKIDQVMLGALLADKSQLGFYSTTVKVAEVFDFLPVIVASSALPELTRAKASLQNYSQKMQVYFDIMMWLWLLIAVPISLFSTPIMTTLYGDSYRAAGPLLALYIWGQFGNNLGLARSSFLIVENKLQYSLYLCVGGAVINILLNAMLIPKYQALGATIATVSTYIIIIFWINFWINDLKPVGWMTVRSLNFYQAISRLKQLLN